MDGFGILGRGATRIILINVSTQGYITHITHIIQMHTYARFWPGLCCMEKGFIHDRTWYT